MAVKVLSGLAAAELIGHIRRGEVDKLVRIPGIGKKTAERMVLELRDKLPAVLGEEAAEPVQARAEATTEQAQGEAATEGETPKPKKRTRRGSRGGRRRRKPNAQANGSSPAGETPAEAKKAQEPLVD